MYICLHRMEIIRDSRVMTRPAGRIRRVWKCRGAGRVGSGRVQNVTCRTESGQQFFKSRGSGRVVSRGFQSHGSGRVGSGRVGSWGHASGRVMTREIRVTSGSGRHNPWVVFGWPRIGPAYLAGGSVFLPTYSCLPEGHSCDPLVLPVSPKFYNTCRFLREDLSRADIPNFERISYRVPCRPITPSISDEAYIIKRTPGLVIP